MYRYRQESNKKDKSMAGFNLFINYNINEIIMLIIKYIKSGRNQRARERSGEKVREKLFVCVFKQIFEIKTNFISSRE